MKKKYLSEAEADAIREVMHKVGFTQDSISTNLGINASFISHILHGRRPLLEVYAKEIYRMLGQPESLSFLKNLTHYKKGTIKEKTRRNKTPIQNDTCALNTFFQISPVSKLSN